jgi:hypothetical protein
MLSVARLFVALEAHFFRAQRATARLVSSTIENV